MSGRMVWVVLVVAPLVINVVAAQAFTAPQQRRVQALRRTRAVTALRPLLEAHMQESDALLTEWGRTAFAGEGVSAVTAAIQRLGEQHRVQVQSISPKPSSMSAGVPFEISATGNFNKLARWLSEIETQAGLQIDSWTVTPGAQAGQPPTLTATVTAFLRRR